MDFDVALASPDHAPAMQALFRRVFEAYAPALGYRPSPMDADYGPLLKDNFVLAARPADASDAPVGFVVTAPRRGYLYVVAIAVDAPWRAQGAGRALLGGAERLAAELCLPVVRLHTPSSLRDPSAFYAAAGYTAIERAGEGPNSRTLFAKRVPTLLDALLAPGRAS